MPAYVVLDIEVTDADAFAKYNESGLWPSRRVMAAVWRGGRVEASPSDLRSYRNASG